MKKMFSHSVLSNIFVSPMDCSPPGSSVYGIFQARILEQAAISLTQGLNPCLLHRLHCRGDPLSLSHWGSQMEDYELNGKK